MLSELWYLFGTIVFIFLFWILIKDFSKILTKCYRDIFYNSYYHEYPDCTDENIKFKRRIRYDDELEGDIEITDSID